MSKEEVKQEEVPQHSIGADLAQAILNYIAATPTGEIPYGQVHQMVMAIQQLPLIEQVEAEKVLNEAEQKDG